MEKPPRNRRRDALVGVCLALALASVIVVSGNEQARATRVPNLSGVAVYQSHTVLEVRGLALGTIDVRDCPRLLPSLKDQKPGPLQLPGMVLGQKPGPGSLVPVGSRINVITCADPS